MERVRDGLTIEERRIFDAELADTTPEKYAAKLSNQIDPVKSFEGRARQASEGRGRKAAEANKQQRLKSARTALKDANFANRSDVDKVVKNKKQPYRNKVEDIRGFLGTQLAKKQAIADFPASQGYTVYDEVIVAEAVGNYKSKAEWQAANPGKDINSVYELIL